MQYDFLLVGSWSPGSQRQMVAWLRELKRRNLTAILLVPNRSRDFSIPDNVDHASLSEYMPENPSWSPSEVEDTFDVPSLDHLVFTEREMFALSRPEAIRRGVRVAEGLWALLSEHTFECSLQIQGPEIHRLLVHHLVESRGGVSIWAGFSPFENTFALKTTLSDSWDAYRTIPYEDIPDEKRVKIRNHLHEFVEQKRFYAHGSDDNGGQSGDTLSRRLGKAASTVLFRNRPGKSLDQAVAEAALKTRAMVNARLYPSVSQSRARCEQSSYVFFPLQYPLESRMTLYSPQFYRQSQLVEFLARTLPSSVELFVKGHPNHPGRPSPRAIRQLSQEGRVRFLNPNLSAHEVIANAEGVVVTNNTVGFETIYHRKPLFTLGRPFYAETPAAIPVNDLSELHCLFAEHLSTEVSEERAISSIYSLRQASFDGDRTRYELRKLREVVDSILQFSEMADD